MGKSLLSGEEMCHVKCSESVHWEIVETTITPLDGKGKHKMKTDCINK